jgi:hypothetical protein
MDGDVDSFLSGRIPRHLAETGVAAAQCPANATKGMTSARLGVFLPAVTAWFRVSAPPPHPDSEI